MNILQEYMIREERINVNELQGNAIYYYFTCHGAEMQRRDYRNNWNPIVSVLIRDYYIPPNLGVVFTF